MTACSSACDQPGKVLASPNISNRTASTPAETAGKHGGQIKLELTGTRFVP